MAAGLAGKRTKNIGLVFYQQDHAISNQFYSFVIEGIVQETIEKNFNLLFSYVGEAYGGTQDLPRTVREKNVDGVILLWRTHPKLVEDIRSRGIPVVAIDPAPVLKGVDTVQIDNRGGGQWAAEHLIHNGHKRIGLLTAPGIPSFQEREEGFRTAHAKANLKVDEALVFKAENLSFWAAYEGAKAFLKKARRMTGIFCVNDEMAAGVLRAAHEVGFKVPDDLSVVGFDNITMANYTDPPLTTISPAKHYMGKLAASRILEAIENKALAPQRHEAPVELIVRGSTRKLG
jgi:DNA-binding LacI/PurR family transcriptional regulator